MDFGDVLFYFWWFLTILNDVSWFLTVWRCLKHTKLFSQRLMGHAADHGGIMIIQSISGYLIFRHTCNHLYIIMCVYNIYVYIYIYYTHIMHIRTCVREPLFDRRFVWIVRQTFAVLTEAPSFWLPASTRLDCQFFFIRLVGSTYVSTQPALSMTGLCRSRESSASLELQ